MRRALALMLLAAAAAEARDVEGHLHVLLTPNEGVPAIASPGGTFRVSATAPASLALTSADGARYPLEPAWAETSGLHEAACAVPVSVPPGVYALEAFGQGTADGNVHCVFIAPALAEGYTFAHIAAPAIGASADGLRAALETVRADAEARAAQIAEQAAQEAAADGEGGEESEPASPPEPVFPLVFIVITGPLTADGTAEQYGLLLEALRACPLPVYVCAGEADRCQVLYEAFLGPVTYRFIYGEDGYLGIGSVGAVGSEVGPEPGLLHRYRRELMARRWTLGFTDTYGAGMGMRSQIALFVDHPIDMLLYAAEPPAPAEVGETVGNEDEKGQFVGVPWGATYSVPTPPMQAGTYRLVDVLPHIVMPHDPVGPGGIEDTENTNETE